MCGIAGLVNYKERELDLDIVPDIWDVQSHRGPDDKGYLALRNGEFYRSREWDSRDRSSSVLLIHRRLAILDLSPSGWQPMISRDGKLAVTYNGEIYNYLELKEELESLGHVFQSTSDTEVLLAAYREWGPQCLRKFVGMIAFAILDIAANTLFLARDFFGIKPLFFSANEGLFVFASTLESILRMIKAPPRIEPTSVFLYLRFGLSDRDGKTMLKDICQLPPAHYAVISLSRSHGVTPVRYWTPSIQNDCQMTFCEAAATLRTLLRKSVSLHMRSDVPFGAALSGGIDSSSIIMLMREAHGTKLDLHSFSFISEDQLRSEEKWIDEVNHAVSATPHKTKPSSDELVACLPDLIKMQGEPVQSTSVFAQHHVFRMARQSNVVVVLEGQGADELFAGYFHYLSVYLASLLRTANYSVALRLLWHLRFGAGVTPLGALVRSAPYLLPKGAQGLLRFFAKKSVVPPWMNWKWFESSGVTADAASITNSCGGTLKEELRHTLVDLTIPRLLRYGDHNAMTHSVENRVPFLTPEIVDFAYSVPDSYLISPHGLTKNILRSAMSGLVPEIVLTRKDKIGFEPPEKMWLGKASRYIKEVVSGETAQAMPVFKNGSLWQYWEEIQSGKRAFDSHLWRCMNLVEWCRLFNVSFS